MKNVCHEWQKICFLNKIYQLPTKILIKIYSTVNIIYSTYKLCKQTLRINYSYFQTEILFIINLYKMQNFFNSAILFKGKHSAKAKLCIDKLSLCSLKLTGLFTYIGRRLVEKTKSSNKVWTRHPRSGRSRTVLGEHCLGNTDSSHWKWS